LKAAVVGAGVFGRHHARKYAHDPRTQLIGIYDHHPDRAAESASENRAGAFADLDELIAAVDILTIATPGSAHFDAARAALEAGKHVLVEKPLATHTHEAKTLIELAAAKNLVLACGHQERLVFEAMGLFSTDAKPLRIESVREGPWTGRGADVSVTLDLMVHDLDLAARLLGDDLERVTAQGVAEHGPAADSVEARLFFRSGAEAVFRASRIAPARKRTMRLVYANGEVNVDFLARSFENSTPLPLNANFSDTEEGRDPLGANVARFIAAAAGEAPRPAVTGAEALAVLDMALAVDRAAGLPSHA
jgi:predicted dehydrogenase